MLKLLHKSELQITWQCELCGKGRTSPLKFWPDKIHHICTPACVHRSLSPVDTALVPCNTCAGNVRLKTPLFRCDLLGTCLLTESMAGVGTCANCEHYRARSTD